MDQEPQQQPPPAIEELQFRRAEFADAQPRPGVRCTACQSDAGPSYFQVGGAPVCGTCAQAWRTQQERPGLGAMLRGAVFGFGGAMAGGLGVGLISAVTGFQLAIAAIGVGWLVGRAFRIGTGGLGGRRAQIAAAILAYLGICMSYAPVIWKAVGDKPEMRHPLARGFATAIIALLAPVIELTEGLGLSGLLGLIIVAVGVMQAWRMLARDRRPLSGPYSTRPEAEAPQP